MIAEYNREAEYREMNLKAVFNPGDDTFDVLDLDTTTYYSIGHSDAGLAQAWIDGFRAGLNPETPVEVRLRPRQVRYPESTEFLPLYNEVNEAVNRRAD